MCQGLQGICGEEEKNSVSQAAQLRSTRYKTVLLLAV